MEMNGGSVVAMVGKDCVAIASDLRLGSGAVGLASNFEKVSDDRSEETTASGARINSSRAQRESVSRRAERGIGGVPSAPKGAREYYRAERGVGGGRRREKFESAEGRTRSIRAPQAKKPRGRRRTAENRRSREKGRVGGRAERK
jgi:hypothetical protein